MGLHITIGNLHNVGRTVVGYIGRDTCNRGVCLNGAVNISTDNSSFGRGEGRCKGVVQGIGEIPSYIMISAISVGEHIRGSSVTTVEGSVTCRAVWWNRVTAGIDNDGRCRNGVLFNTADVSASIGM